MNRLVDKKTEVIIMQTDNNSQAGGAAPAASAPREGGGVPGLYNDLSTGRRLQILSAIAIGTFMAPLDSSVVNIALPTIRTSFNTSLGMVEWVIMSYLLVISSLILTYGRLGDLFGHKKIYLSGFAIFTSGSLLCGLAPSILALIIFRALQAIGAGMMMAMGPAIITNITPPQHRGKSMGVVAVSVSVALTVGPVVGGFLTAAFGWPSIFYINIPIGILGSLWAWKVIPSMRGRVVEPFDIKGAILIFVSLLAMLIPLSYTEQFGWRNPYILGSLAAGIILLLVFIFVEKSVKYPMVDLTLFRNRLFAMGNISALLNFVSSFAVILIMPFYLQQLRLMTAEHAGLLLIPTPLATMIAAPIAGAISDKVDSRYISSLGMAINAVGLWMLSRLQVDSSELGIVVILIVIGIGVGMFQTPNNSAVMGSVPPNRRGIGSGLLVNMRNIGMVLGVAVSGALFGSRQDYLNRILAAQGTPAPEAKIQSFIGAMQFTFMFAAVLALVAVFTSLVRGPINTVGRDGNRDMA